ncbi:MAG TPA: aminoglycoside phosphotransferase family protein [Anaerolineaceae bacterium]|nr:aminoglycoside phosphotransferase family protein [Anaerolineaceae bacterium]
MFEKPTIPDELIAACLRTEYNLPADSIDFLPLGADQNTAVYRVATPAQSYFLKLRRGLFDEIAVALPKYLFDQGITQIIPPLPTVSGSLWGSLQGYKTILAPFVIGRNGYEVRLSDHHWLALGQALKRIHTAPVPLSCAAQIPRETYSPCCREMVKTFLQQIEVDQFTDPVAAQTAALLQANRPVIEMLLLRAETLALKLSACPAECVICHADLHAGNLLVGSDDSLYLVDWDTLILAPKEHDLMFIGAGLLGDWYTPAEESERFYPAYGSTRLNRVALAYYRYERILQDIAAFCEQLLLTAAGGEDREQSLYYLESNFKPNATIAIACQADQLLW